MEMYNNPIEAEMKELADQVREHYPMHPEQAFAHFRNSYPEIVSVTMVSLVWSYFEIEQMMRTGIKFTRPLERQDIQLFRSPFTKN